MIDWTAVGCAPEDVIDTHGGLVRQAVRRSGCVFRLPIDEEELMGYGWELFLKACHSYRPEKGLAFSSWATCCVKNGIVDIWRVMYGRRAGQNRRLEGRLESTDRLMALGWDVRGTAVVPLDDLEPYLRRLKDNERDVLWETYGHGEGLAEYGARHGYSESRACQIRRQALAKIRVHLGV